MKDLERMFRQTDFSKYTDLKARLANQLFGQKEERSATITAFPFARLSDTETEMVRAAQGIMYKDPNKKDED